MQLLEKTVFDDNRKLLYDILMGLDADICLKYMGELIEKTSPKKEMQKREHFVGIKNLGSICYMNSILQQFFVIE